MAPNPNAEVVVIEVSPTTLINSRRYVCEVCSKGFPRKQNLLLHGRAHNLPFTLKTRKPNDPIPRKVYLCPEPTCIHHNRSHAIGDFAGLKKHYMRKHERVKKHKCDTCPKAYSVESDLKAHRRVCASRLPRGNFTAYQENCEAPQHVGAVTSTGYNNRSNILIGSTSSYPHTLEMGDNQIRFNTNQSGSSLIAPQFSFIQNQPNYYPFTTAYPSEFGQFRADHSDLMTYPPMALNLTEVTSQFQSQLSQFGADCSDLMSYPPTVSNLTGVPPQLQASSSNQNLHGREENNDISLYADLLLCQSFENMNLLEKMNVNGNYENVYNGESSKSFIHGTGFRGEPSGTFNFTPAIDGVLNPATASSVEGWYEQGGYKSYVAESCGMEKFHSEHQPQQPLPNENVEDTSVHWNIYGQGEDTPLFLDDGCMLDPSNSLNFTPAGHNQGLDGMMNPVGSSDVGSYEQEDQYWQWILE